MRGNGLQNLDGPFYPSIIGAYEMKPSDNGTNPLFTADASYMFYSVHQAGMAAAYADNEALAGLNPEGHVVLDEIRAIPTRIQVKRTARLLEIRLSGDKACQAYTF